MSHLSLLYFGIIITMVFGINGHIYMYVPCQRCLMNYTIQEIYENNEFCEECIPNYNYFAFQRRKQNLFNLPKSLSDYRNYKVTMKTVNLSELLMTSINQEQLFFFHNTELTCGTMNLYDDVTYTNSAKEQITGILSNIEAFSEAFNCSVGSPMNPKLKCENWKEASEEYFYCGTD